MTTFLLALLAGAFGWTFTEYGMHHWNGHLARGKLKFSREHLAHHRESDYFTSNLTKAQMALPIISVVFAVAWWLSGALIATGFTLGLGAAYIGYEWLHWACHARAPRTRFGRWARRNHFYHHFTSAKYNHGVTSPIWDVVFRTHRSPGFIRVPPKHVMTWLVDDAGEVKPEYADDYAISSRRKAA
jgi:sterol desaturase/sphingolipid hydroxylase (fatty acid hydroxylase superfamily)